jgi:hypothetical protein
MTTSKDVVTPLALSSTDQIWLDLNLRCAWPDHGSLLPNLSPHRHFTAGAKLLAEQGDEFARAAWLPREGDLKSECFVGWNFGQRGLSELLWTDPKGKPHRCYTKGLLEGDL